MAEIKKTERILNLASFLLKVRERRPVPWREIRDRVVGYDDGATGETLRRRFERDKRFLEAVGLEIEYISDGPAGDGYRLRREVLERPPLSIGPSERALLAGLAGSRAALGQARDTPFARHLHAALLKLRFDDDAPDATDPAAVPILPAPATPPLEALEALAEAVALRRRVAFAYRAARRPERPAHRTVDPYGLHARGRTWYLVGRCHDRQALRTFRVDRIDGRVEPSRSGPTDRPDFDPPPDFRLDAQAAREAWQFAAPEGTSGPALVARVAFDAEAFWRIAGRPDAVDAIEDADGSGAASFQVRDPEAFVRWILSHGCHARILSPSDLVDRLVARVEAILTAGLPATGAGAR